MIYELFLVFLKIGAICFGGGYAIMPLLKSSIIDEKGWLTLTEFADLITISEMTPGPIAINAATFIGARNAGILGAITATVAFMLPGAIIVSILFFVYSKYRNISIVKGAMTGIKPAITGMIAYAALTIFVLAIWNAQLSLEGLKVIFDIKNFDWLAFAIFIFSFFCFKRFKKLNPVIVLLISGIVGIVGYSFI